jgi:alcohol dehydrogenase (cytochrome c)
MKTFPIKVSRGARPKAWLCYALRSAFLIGLGWVMLGVGIYSCIAATQDDFLTNPYAPDDQQAIGHGGELFGRNCQQCHNSRGKGGKAPQLIRGAWGPGGANSDAYMFNTINAGRKGTEMGTWGFSLPPDDIWAIITFLRAEAVKAKVADDQDDQ